jgi:hypothetical protein
MIAAPLNWVEAAGRLHFPSKADRRLQELMDRNNEGLLDQSESEELEALIELSSYLSCARRLCRFWASGPNGRTGTDVQVVPQLVYAGT